MSNPDINYRQAVSQIYKDVEEYTTQPKLENLDSKDGQISLFLCGSENGDGRRFIHVCIEDFMYKPFVTLEDFCKQKFQKVTLNHDVPTNMYSFRVRLLEGAKHVYVDRKDKTVKLPSFVSHNFGLLKQLFLMETTPCLPRNLTQQLEPQDSVEFDYDKLQLGQKGCIIAKSTILYHTGAFVGRLPVVSHSNFSGKNFDDVESKTIEFLGLYPVFQSTTLTTHVHSRESSVDGVALGMYVATEDYEIEDVRHIFALRGNPENNKFRAQFHELALKISQTASADDNITLCIWGTPPKNNGDDAYVIDAGSDVDVVFIHPEKCESVCAAHVAAFVCKENKTYPALTIYKNNTQIIDAQITI